MPLTPSPLKSEEENKTTPRHPLSKQSLFKMCFLLCKSLDFLINQMFIAMLQYKIRYLKKICNNILLQITLFTVHQIMPKCISAGAWYWTQKWAAVFLNSRFSACGWEFWVRADSQSQLFHLSRLKPDIFLAFCGKYVIRIWLRLAGWSHAFWQWGHSEMSVGCLSIFN